MKFTVSYSYIRSLIRVIRVVYIMAISKDKKKEIVKKVSDAVKGSKSVVFVNFHGITVKDSTKVRKQLKTHDIKFLVAKKTLTERALKDAGIAGEMPALLGEIGLAYGADLIAPAREVFSFKKELDTKFGIVGGIFDGKFMNQSEMLSIATIPDQKTLYAQFVNLINSPIQGFVMALSEIAKSKS